MVTISAFSSPLHSPFPTSRLPSPRAPLRLATVLKTPPSTASPLSAVAPRKVLDDTHVEPRNTADFLERSREMVSAVGASGPARWFTPLECDGRTRLEGAPTLLYFPGFDGVGWGLIRHHQRLKRMFDIWCLHTPAMDRTPFEGLLEYVEMTLQLQRVHLECKPVYLVGECIGACLAYAVAARNPHIDFVIVSVNPGTSFCMSPLPSLLSFSDVIPATLDAAMLTFLKFAVGDSTRAMTYIGRESFEGLPESLAAMITYLHLLVDILPRESFIWKLKMLKVASSYANSRLHSVKSQMLILASGRDLLLPNFKEAERICRLLPKCRIRYFKDSDHAMLLEGSVDLISAMKGAAFYRRSTQVDYVSDYLLPTVNELRKIQEQNRWINIAMDPVMLSTLENGKIVRGLSGIPSEGPAILVGYHMLLGWELAPMVTEFLTKKNILLRGIAHPFIFDEKAELIMPDPASFDPFKIMGACPVSPINFYKLLAEKSFILLYPGGVREALHRKGEEYMLFWPEQSEVVRMASRFGAKIIPFGVVGEDDICEMLLDYDDLTNIPIYRSFFENLNEMVTNVRNDSSGEIQKQEFHLPAVVPKIPGRFYYLFGKPIDTKGIKLDLKERKASQELYVTVKSEVEKCLAFLKEKRKQDPYRNSLSRLFYLATRGFSSEVPTFDV